MGILSLILLLAYDASAKTHTNKMFRDFYLLSKYTEQKLSIDEKAFEKLYTKISNHKIRVYQNGETYQLLVPLSKIYIENSSNYKPKGVTVVKDLADFIEVYQPEVIQFSGIVFQDGIENMSQHLGDTAVKGEHLTGSVVQKTTKHPKLDPVLVSLAQTSRMVAEMRAYNPQFARIGLSVTERVYEVDAFAHILTRHINKDSVQGQGKIRQIQAVIEDVIFAENNFKLYDEGSVIIEFKKF